MQHAEQEERERRFKLALRAGVPVLLLVVLIFYTSFSKDGFVQLSLEHAMLIGGLLFITVYFIYFLLEVGIKETLIDQVSGGYTRESLIRRLKIDQPQTVAFVVINNLSTIDDNYGADSANRILHTIVTRIHHYAHQYDIEKLWVGRYSGAEFVIAVDHKNTKTKEFLRQFIQENQTIDTVEIEYLFAVINNTVNITPDKIITLLQDQIKAIETKKIDANETEVKDTTELSQLEQSIIKSLKNEQISFYFRPLLNIKKNCIDTYEIAVKLRTESGDEILPRDYLPVVNRLGLGRAYDLLVFKHTVDTALLTDSHISFSFNISPFSLRDKDFFDTIFNIVEEKDVDPNRMIFEIYERKTHHDLSSYLKTLSRIRAKGIRICIDNFGSSNASMEYMKHFKFDMIQFDRDFATQLNNPNNLSILKSMIKMSRELQIETVAKWVDKDDQKQILIDLGIDYIQGFGVAKQLSEYELIEQYNQT